MKTASQYFKIESVDSGNGVMVDDLRLDVSAFEADYPGAGLLANATEEDVAHFIAAAAEKAAEEAARRENARNIGSGILKVKLASGSEQAYKYIKSGSSATPSQGNITNDLVGVVSEVRKGTEEDTATVVISVLTEVDGLVRATKISKYLTKKAMISFGIAVGTIVSLVETAKIGGVTGFFAPKANCVGTIPTDARIDSFAGKEGVWCLHAASSKSYTWSAATGIDKTRATTLIAALEVQQKATLDRKQEELNSASKANSMESQLRSLQGLKGVFDSDAAKIEYLKLIMGK